MVMKIDKTVFFSVSVRKKSQMHMKSSTHVGDDDLA